jgi:iron-regulated transporter 1
MSNTSALQKKLLLGRILTRSGDQAWDFAVPLAILKLMPGELQYAALYYFMIKLSNVLILPHFSSMIDRVNRFKAAKIGISVQLIGVLIGVVSLVYLSFDNFIETRNYSFTTYIAMVFLVLGGCLGSVGSSFMDISIANDLVPSSLDEDELVGFNSKLRQIDLFTEFGSPIIAGLFLAFEMNQFLLFGFSLVALWNVISFFPEYLLLKLIFDLNPELSSKTVSVSASIKTTLFEKMTSGLKAFLKEPIAIVSLAYACLWLSVLSPHGVLLTGFLKDGWSIPEWGIGLFRGAGGFFGLMATVTFPRVTKRYGIKKSTSYFLFFQLITVSFALFCFFGEDLTFQIGFMVAILFSRIGLYGFSLGEMQLRQLKIPQNVRGEFNGFANALTGIATLGLYGGGALLPTTGDFKYLVMVSVVMVLVSFVLYQFWQNKQLSLQNH